MTVKDQQKAFNESLAAVTRTNKDLAIIYKDALSEIEKELAAFKLKIEKGQLSGADARRKARLIKLYDDINDKVKTLYTKRDKTIVDNYTTVEIEAYYKTGFSYEKDVNKFIIDRPYDYSIGYTKQNPAFIRQTYLNTSIGGMTFMERSAVDRVYLQSKVKSIVERAIIDGLTVKDVAKKLGELDSVLLSDLSKAQTTARTELLRGYSIGNENAITEAKVAGVEGKEIWDATLDSRTRPSHSAKDQTEPEKDGLWHFEDGSAAAGPRMPGLSAAQSINCRCYKQYRILDVTPTRRGGRTPGGSWSTKFGGKTWEDWASDQEAAGTIEKETQKKLNIVRKLKKA